MLKHKIVTGLGYGDEGKGTVVDALCARSDYGYVVRHSGGPQAAHNVVDDLGRHHTFSQFGSGTLSYTPTILSRFMMVNPYNLMNEAVHLSKTMGVSVQNLLDNLYISDQALVVTPYHIEYNKAMEKARGDNAHGSCAQGVGFTQEFALRYPDKAIRMRDLYEDDGSLFDKLEFLEDYVVTHTDVDLHDMDSEIHEICWDYRKSPLAVCVTDDETISDLIAGNPCVFEGSQGVLLDEWHGFHPHTTWSTTTDHNARILLAEAGVKDEDIESIGVIRTYHTRHGHGPFPSELKYSAKAMGLMAREQHNAWGEFQGEWRVGAFDMDLFKYAIKCMDKKPDWIAVTHADIDDMMPVTTAQQNIGIVTLAPNEVKTNENLVEREEKFTKPLLGVRLKDIVSYSQMMYVPSLINYIEFFGQVPVGIISRGPGRLDKEFKEGVE